MSRCIYPHTEFWRTPVGSSKSHVSVSLYVSLSGRMGHFLVIIKERPVIVRSTWGRRARVKSPEWQNDMSGHPVVRENFSIFVFVLNIFNTIEIWLLLLLLLPVWGSSVPMHFPYTGVSRTQVGSSRSYMYVCLYVRLSISLSLYMVVCVTFCQSKRTAHNCAQLCSRSPRSKIPWVTVLYILPPGCPWSFCNVCFCIQYF